MREILFRGKRIDDGEWVEGLVLSLNDEEHGKCAAIVPVNSESYRFNLSGYYVQPLSVCQFTGLLDKNGKKIFEGDIVKTKYGRLCSVMWFSSNCVSGWDFKPIDTPDNILRTKAPSGYDIFAKENLEIIGNIHD